MRVLISAQPHLRSALSFLLEQQWGAHTLSEVSDAYTLVGRSKEVFPDVVLLDWELLRPSQVNVLTDLHELPERPYIIVLSSHPEFESMILATGADAFIGKDKPADTLVPLLRSLLLCPQCGHDDQT